MENCAGTYAVHKSLTVRLQSKTMDIANAFMRVQTLNATLQDLRTNINIRHQSWYDESVKLANDHHIAAEKPRCCKAQLYRENHDISDLCEYYKVTITLQFLDSIIETMQERFSPKHLALYSGFNVLPPIMMVNASWREGFETFIKEFSDDFVDICGLDAELHL